MADTRVLLFGLIEYRRSLQNHLIRLRTEFNQLERRWVSFSSVYEGDAADQFRAEWLNTTRRFREYVDRGNSILLILDNRIEALEAANAPDSSIG